MSPRLFPIVARYLSELDNFHVRFGSEAVLQDNISLMSAFGRKAVIQMLDCECPILITWAVLANVRFSQ